MRTRHSTLLLLAFLGLLTFCQADLPIHCLRQQVAGKWKLQISEPTESKELLAFSCGHESPDNPANSYLSQRESFVSAQEFLVTLNNDTQVLTDGESKGIWTMIYDEGFDILLDNHKFTSFFDYFPDEFGKVTSFCGKTVVGWYVDADSNKKACFRAEKQVASEEEKAALYAAPLTQMKVVQPPDTISALQIQGSSRHTKALKGSATAASETKVQLGKDFKDHGYVVDKLNKLPNKLWNAGVKSMWEGKSIEELNRLAGRKKLGGGPRPSLQNMFMQKADVSDLPKEFSWKDSLPPQREQGECGSCYVFASLSMIEARLKIKYEKDIRLSPQHVLDCSYYNQGCDGGYPYLVEKFANEFQLVPETCSPYIAKKGSCGTCDLNTLDEVYKVENYKFVGGAYGKSNEREMMLEIMNNGPIIASFEPPYNFMFYQGGIYHGVEPEWVKNGENQPDWERVDHAVLLYGWGETEKGEKYWTLLNSWGDDWGEEGSFRMVRGTDECAIESMGEAADPIIVNL